MSVSILSLGDLIYLVPAVAVFLRANHKSRSKMAPMNFNLPGFLPEVTVILTKDISKDQLLNFIPFKNWLIALKASLALQSRPDHPFYKAPYTLRSVTIQSVDYFGPNIGFVKLVADVKNEDNERLPGVAFLRGGSVAILMILRPSDAKNERWVIMTEQPRVPAGSLRFMEIPAGMVDQETHTFAGTAAREIKEETDLEIQEDELIDLTALALKAADQSESLRPEPHLQTCMYPSPGGSDEFIALFLWEKVLDRQEIEDLKGKLTGLRTQEEKITVRILNYEDLWKVGARDAKTLAAWSLYEGLKRARNPALLDRRIW